MQNKRTFCCLILWFKTLVLLAMCRLPDSSPLTLRIRLPTGSSLRIPMGNDSSVADLCEKIRLSGAFVPSATDHVHVGEYRCDFLAATNNVNKLAEYGIRNGDLIDITSKTNTTSTVNGPMRQTMNAHTSGKKSSRRRYTLADLEKERASLVKVTREPADTNLQVIHREGTEIVFQRLVAGRNVSTFEKVDCGKIALLVGRFENSSSSAGVAPTQIVEVKGVFEVGMCGYNASAGLRDSEVFWIGKALTVANALGMHVVGVALGSISTFTSNSDSQHQQSSTTTKRGGKKGMGLKEGSSGASLWQARHVYCALQVRAAAMAFVGSRAGLPPHSDDALVRDPFLLLSVTKESHAAGDMSTLNVRVEAFRLSSQALELHRNGTLPAVPCCKARDVEGEGDVVYLNTVVRGAAAGADDSSEVDSVLLCVPVAIRSSGSAGSGTVVGAGDGVDAGAMETEKKIELEMEMQHLFPSMAELQHDPLVAEVARQYLLKLLGRVTQPLRDNSTSEGGEPLEARLLSRFRDPQLLLYLSTVMEPEAFGGLCEQLRSVDAATTISKRSIIGSRTLPLEVQVALEQVRLSLL